MNKLIIEKDKLIQNIEIIKGLSRSKIIAILKANGYGLGLLEFAGILQENGIDFFGVSNIQDAVRLAKNGFKRVLLLTPTNQEDKALLIVKNKVTATVGSLTSAIILNDAALKLNTTADFHLKIDTGFGRFGFLPSEIPQACTLLKGLENIRITGTYSHFSFAFSKKTKAVYSQYNAFIDAVNLMRQSGLQPGMLHICNSSAFLMYPQMHLDASRIGSAFLGRTIVKNTCGLQKIGYLKSTIIECKEIPKNHNIGYANTYKTRRNTKIGIVPVGYLDGFGLEKARDAFRIRDISSYIYRDIMMLNKKMYVTISGKQVRILGKINTHNIIVDITDIDAKVGDEVLLNINPMLVGPHIEREYV
ncbi:alanine racemase [Caldicoprobacter faecalis]|uniref:Alanine racemase n=1 Tax=Caldicoprobacter faecalis TaxID=937334 RepID=A0A1I5T9A3_9FIRM|nr:alanine racemase [Caldicoprobacter faecalis]SFP79538.1 alanine racemase [Caldicoprobacter faecalis]